MKRLFVFSTILFILCFFVGTSAKTSSVTKNSSTIQGDPGVYDSEYVHDEKVITKKVTQLKDDQQVILMSGTFDQLNDIIVENELLKSFENWRGTRYSWGGDSKSGIDCSALTRRVYREVFEFELPRVSVDQAQRGVHISKSELRPGDILFFRPENRVNHTAVYVGNSLFINASSSQGVVLSSLENKYWGKYFKYGVRIAEK